MKTETLAARKLKFPEEGLPGKLYLQGEGLPKEPVELAGTIEVPEGASAALMLGDAESKGEPVDLGVLASFAPGDVQMLMLSNFDQDTLPAIAHLTGVASVTLALDGPLTASLAPIADLGVLSVLQIRASELSDEALAGLKGVEGVSHLGLMAKLTAAQMRDFPALEAEAIAIGPVDGVTVDDVIAFAQRMPKLKDLGLRGVGEEPVLDAEGRAKVWAVLPDLTINRTWYAPSAVSGSSGTVSIPEGSGDPNVKPVDLTVATFDEAIATDTPVLVDFWAEWCGPCKRIAPTIEQLAGELAGRVTVAKVDVDHNKEISDRYGIRGIPALFVFRGGELVAKIGSQSRDGILEELGPILA